MLLIIHNACLFCLLNRLKLKGPSLTLYVGESAKWWREAIARHRSPSEKRLKFAMWSKEKSVETHLSSASGSVETTLLAKCALSRDDEILEFYDNIDDYLQLIPNN